jgi:hypothetical protein
MLLSGSPILAAESKKPSGPPAGATAAHSDSSSGAKDIARALHSRSYGIAEEPASIVGWTAAAPSGEKEKIWSLGN